MTLPDLIAALKARGLTHVRTFGPLLPLEEWNPYGMEPGGVNYREGGHRYRGEIVERDGQTEVHDSCDDDDLRHQCQLVIGVWRFTSEEAQ